MKRKKSKATLYIDHRRKCLIELHKLLSERIIINRRITKLRQEMNNWDNTIL